MDESEYKRALEQLNPTQCIFEKALFTTLCECRHSKRFSLADRQGIRCNDESARRFCVGFLTLLRDNSRFLFQQTHVENALPHGKEIKVQLGGLLAIQNILSDEQNTICKVQDIYQILADARTAFDNYETLPLQKIIKTIGCYKVRGRSKRL